MEYLADIVLRDVYSSEQIEGLFELEAQAVRRLYIAGIIRIAWSRGDVRGAFLVLEAPSVDAADAALQLLPLIRNGMAEAQIIALHGYRGFGPR